MIAKHTQSRLYIVEVSEQILKETHAKVMSPNCPNIYFTIGSGIKAMLLEAQTYCAFRSLCMLLNFYKKNDTAHFELLINNRSKTKEGKQIWRKMVNIYLKGILQICYKQIEKKLNSKVPAITKIKNDFIL